MNVAFQCAKEEDAAWPEEQHETSFVMRRCTRCDKPAIAGYSCETCGHEDLDPADRLAGHGAGKCQPAEGDASA